jgi:hypothetical protein
MRNIKLHRLIPLLRECVITVTNRKLRRKFSFKHRRRENVKLIFLSGLHAIGTMASPLLAMKVLFKTASRAGLFNLQLEVMKEVSVDPCLSRDRASPP